MRGVLELRDVPSRLVLADYQALACGHFPRAPGPLGVVGKVLDEGVELDVVQGPGLDVTPEHELHRVLAAFEFGPERQVPIVLAAAGEEAGRPIIAYVSSITLEQPFLPNAQLK